jgi:hypothetical protein
MTKLVLSTTIAAIILAVVIPTISAANELGAQRTKQMQEIENIFNQ